MGKPKRRDLKRKKVSNPGAGNNVATAWKRLYQCTSEGHPAYRPNRADTIFGQRALSMGLTNAKTKKIVDIGGGKGHFTSKLKRPNAEATIVDFSGTSLFPHNIKAHNIKGKAEKLPKEWTGKFGVALLSYSLSYTDKRKTIAEARRVLEKGGRLVALLHHPNSIYVKSIMQSNISKKRLLNLLVDVKKKRIKNMEQFREAAAKAFAGKEVLPENAGEVFKAAEIYFENRRASRHSSRTEQKMYEQDFDNYIRVCNQMSSAFGPLLKPGAMFSNQADVRKFFEENGFKVRVLKTLRAPGKGMATEPICYGAYVEKK